MKADGYDRAVVRSRLRGLRERQDKAPSLWPVLDAERREFMVDCEFCPSRMPLSAMTFHIRRHARRGDAKLPAV